MVNPTLRFLIRLQVAALALAALASPCVAQVGRAGAYQGYDWPNRHGPAYDNISREKGWTATWPPSGPKIAWEKKVGIGFASVSVDKGLLFTMGNDSNRETIYGLDANSGKVVWRHTYPAKLLPKLHEGGPTCTPTVADGRVFTLGKEGRVHCLEAETGQVVWQADLKKILKIKTPEWGFASSPLILDGQVIFQAGATISFDRNSGRQKWKSRAYPAAYTTPQPFTFGGAPGLAVLNSTGLVILNPTGGQELS
ncbi:MAG: PQQ-like beta-propeller repeat protein, partial [Phycisphaerae bacterium]|nr:PQQ-like beta-propeller repeat protein [Phycisphaerae bacterium]